MRKLLTFLAAASVGATVAVAGQDDAARVPGGAKAARSYAALLKGKVPGKPVDCIETQRPATTLSAYGDKLIYRVDRDLVYVNDTNGGGCANVARGDALISQRFQTRACRGDIAQTVSLPPGIFTGSCALGSFTPYRTAK